MVPPHNFSQAPRQGRQTAPHMRLKQKHDSNTTAHDHINPSDSPPLLDDAVEEVPAAQQLHDDVDALLRLKGVQHLDDVRLGKRQQQYIKTSTVVWFTHRVSLEKTAKELT